MRTISSVAYSEVYEIINQLEDDLVNKIPQKLIEFFDEERDKNYSPKIDINLPLNEQKINRHTMILLTILNLNYWCETKEEKQELLKILNENEEKVKQRERQLKEGNFNNFLKGNVNKVENSESNTDLVQYKKESLIQKLFHRIKKLLNKS